MPIPARQSGMLMSRRSQSEAVSFRGVRPFGPQIHHMGYERRSLSKGPEILVVFINAVADVDA
jgi:hypothetical protein